jgi:two-component system, chemotaxis family, chemotaxis protein CheY
MGYRVVAVDDNAVVTGLIAAVLGQAGYEVETAPAGGEALVILQRNPPDLLLLDLEMPGLDGLEVLRILRDEKVCQGVPVIMLTGESDGHYVGRARELGASGYLLKPFRAEQLRAQVKRVMEDADTVWLDDYHTVTRSAQDGWARPQPAASAKA